MYPSERRYTSDHEWVKSQGEECLVGITLFAQEELGDVVFVELPERGTVVKAGDEIGSVESVKAVAEIYSPISGELIDVNEKVGDTPELLNEDPHGEGWLVRLRMADADELATLMTAEQYEALVAAGAQGG